MTQVRSDFEAAPDRPTLLLVDDQPANLHHLYEILKDRYTLLAANSGEAALRLCAEHLPDLVLLDVVMPGKTGLQVCVELRANPRTHEIPVIFLTSGDSPAEENACWEAGCVDFIVKPANPVTVDRRISVHLRLKRQADRLRAMASTDGLTGLANRRAFDRRFAELWRSCWRRGDLLSLAILDIDWFKGFNDHYGHAAGDDALKLVANTMASQLNRPQDMVARLGGEEFVMLLPDTSEAGSLVVVNRMLSELDRLSWPHAGSPLGHLTLSAGVASLVPGPARSKTRMLELADSRLYLAKQGGRNRAVGEPGLPED